MMSRAMYVSSLIGGLSSLHWASDFSLLANRAGETLPKYLACALIPELLADVATGVDEYVSHVTATILVAGDDEVPGVTWVSRFRSSRMRE